MSKRKNSPLCKVGESYTVDMQTGETVPTEGGGLYMLPGPPGTCEFCHVAHEPDLPHNQQSLAYQMKFHAIHKRWPTWSDAMAHCSEEVKTRWRQGLVERMQAHGLEIPEDLS